MDLAVTDADGHVDQPKTFSCDLSIIHAARDLAVALGVGINPWNSTQIPAFTAHAVKMLGKPRNAEFELAPSIECQTVSRELIQHKIETPRSPPVFLNERPAVLPAEGNVLAVTPDIYLLSVNDGALCNIGGAPIVVASDKRTIVQDCSSYYTGMIHFYDFSFSEFLQETPYIDGVVFGMFIDIGPNNYCHWLIDYLPRLAHLRNRMRNSDVYLAVPPVTTAFQRETLKLCGFAEDRIIELKHFGGIRARELIVLDDCNAFYHPAHNAAPWALDYLRSVIGLPSAVSAGLSRPPRKLFVSRADAGRRRIVNEGALMDILRPAGYEYLVPSGMSYEAQIASFAGASHIIGPHGAGLTNLIFSRADAQLLEILPPAAGTPAYYMLCAGTKRPYYAYCAANAKDARPGTEDLEIDLAAFEQCAGPYL